MTRGRLWWSFADRCEAAECVEDVAELFLTEVASMGFSYAACASHVDPLKPPRNAVMIVHYPTAWLQHFSESNYAVRDPVFQIASRRMSPFRWTDPRFRARLKPDQARILAEAGEAGLRDGFTIPLHAPGALPASCSLAIGPDGVDPLHVKEAHWCAVFAHEAARRLLEAALGVRNKVKLSPRERQCLELVGRGKDDYAIGAILGIHQTTAHNTVQRAMRRYGVATRVQAVVRALADGEIRIEDVAE